MKNVLITGGTGLIGKEISTLLIKNGYSVSILSRSNKKNKNQIKYFQWDINTGKIDLQAFNNVDYIIHLAGANIGDQRWTNARKEELINSRIKSTKLLFDTVNNNKIELRAFISTSAIGFYGGVSSDKIMFEEDENGEDFIGNLCKKWEAESLRFESIGVKTVILRNGIVLSNKGGALMKMMKPVKYAINAAIGTGKQYMPWIQIKDLCKMYLYAIENELNGVFNAVAPEHINNYNFSKQLSKSANKPFFMPNIPAFIMKILFGELSIILLEGSRISCQKILDLGFKFEYNSLEQSLEDLID